MAGEESNDLRSALADAVAESEAAAVTPAEIPAREEKPAPPIPEAKTEEAPAETTGTRQRGADGRFLPKDGETQAEADAEGEAQAAAPPKDDGEAKPAAEKPPAATDTPAHWSQADKEMVAKLPAEFRGEVVDRIKRIEAGFTPKLQKLAQVEKEYGGAMEVFAPYIDQIRQRGQTPSDVIAVWASMEQAFLSARMAQQSGRTDPQALAATDNGAQMVARIIQAYNIDPAHVAGHLQGTAQRPNGAQTNGTGNGYHADPALMQEINAIKQTLSARDQQEAAAKTQSAQQQIESFASEKNADGTPKHPYFSELEDDITQLAQFERSQGRSVDLSALYDRAVWLNGSTRERQLSSQRQADEKRAADERRAKTEAAKRASSSVSGAPSPGATSQRASTNRSLRDDLMTAAEEAMPAR